MYSGSLEESTSGTSFRHRAIKIHYIIKTVKKTTKNLYSGPLEESTSGTSFRHSTRKPNIRNKIQ